MLLAMTAFNIYFRPYRFLRIFPIVAAVFDFFHDVVKCVHFWVLPRSNILNRMESHPCYQQYIASCVT